MTAFDPKGTFAIRYAFTIRFIDEGRLTEAVEEQLDPSKYIRIHRSCIDNFQMIRSMVRHGDRQLKLKLRNGVELTTSRASGTSLRSFIRDL